MNDNLLKIYLLVLQNPEILEFFKMINGQAKDIRTFNEKQEISGVHRFAKEYEKVRALLDKQMTVLEGLGIHLSKDTKFYPEGYIPARTESWDKSAWGEFTYHNNAEMISFHDSHDYTNPNHLSFPASFNGVALTYDQINDPNTAIEAIAAYNNWHQEHISLAKETDELKDKILKEKSRLFGGNQKTIEAMQLSLEQKKGELAVGDRLKRRSDFFSNLTGKQREEIVKYLELLKQINDLCVIYKLEIHNSIWENHGTVDSIQKRQKEENKKELDEATKKYNEESVPKIETPKSISERANLAIEAGYVTGPEAKEIKTKLSKIDFSEGITVQDYKELTNILKNGVNKPDKEIAELVLAYCREILNKKTQSINEESNEGQRRK